MLKTYYLPTGVMSALTAALLFGASTPLAKLLLVQMNPWLLAGLLYLGSGIGLSLYRFIKQAPKVDLAKHELAYLLGAVLLGGVLAPVLLLAGLAALPASTASLLLNAETVFTALLAWYVFRENVDKRIALGMLAIVAGALVLSYADQTQLGSLWPSMAVLGACLAWGLDNNLTRKVALNDAAWLAAIKGLVAGSINLLLAFLIGSSLPNMALIGSTLLLGFLCYGISLSLFVLSLRHLGTARTGAYFAVAPFFGALLSIILLHEAISINLILAGLLMAIGIYLHLTEQHNHEHCHPAFEHEHEHSHDEHHQHEHENITPTKHSHWHKHEFLVHTHQHYPDAHHQHKH